MIDLEGLLVKSCDFVDYYIVEIINMNAAGYKFKKLLRENYPESYAIASDREKFKEFIKETKEILRKSRVKVLQFVTHYPKFECINLEENNG